MARNDQMLYRMAYRMAMADGELSANEALILHLFQDAMGVTKEELRQLREEATSLNLSELASEIPGRKERLELLETACVMAMIDGRADLKEWDLIIRICEVLDIERPEAQACLGRARERLQRLASKHNLLPEILKNLDRAEAEDAEEA